MDAKITLSFEETVIKKKKICGGNKVSLFPMMEFILRKITSSSYQSLEDFPVSDWVQQITVGEAVYQTKARTPKKPKQNFIIPGNENIC